MSILRKTVSDSPKTNSSMHETYTSQSPSRTVMSTQPARIKVEKADPRAKGFMERINEARAKSIAPPEPEFDPIETQMESIKEKIRDARKNNLLEDKEVIGQLIEMHQKLLDMIVDDVFKEVIE